MINNMIEQVYDKAKKLDVLGSLRVVFMIFFVGLLLQFVMQTFVTFELGIEIPWLWLRKEVLVLGLGWLTLGWLWYTEKLPWVGQDKLLKKLLLVTACFLFFSFVSSILVNHIWIVSWVSSLKYTVFPFFVFLAFYVAFAFWWHFVRELQSSDLMSTSVRCVKFVGMVLTTCLLLGLLRYSIIVVKPGTLKYVGYDPLVYEWHVGEAPPTVYRSQYNHGRARNQFVFERPIMRGFYLIAFWPLFFVLYLRHHGFGKRRFEWFLYVANVFVTFSRAARWVFIIETIVLLLLTYGKWWWEKLLGGKFRKWPVLILVLSFVLFINVLVFFGLQKYSHLFEREYSDKWHVESFVEWIVMVIKKPIWGYGWWSAGPSSFQVGDGWQSIANESWLSLEILWGTGWNSRLKQSQSTGDLVEKMKLNSSEENNDWGFNPENQFLQVVIEYGLVTFVFWIAFYYFLFVEVYQSLLLLDKKWNNKHIKLLLVSAVALGIGLMWLMIEWLVLHSLSDRMSVYPLMALMAVVMAAVRMMVKGGR